MARVRVGQALEQFRRLFGGQRTGPAGDGELLQRFLVQRDEDAFAALVERYGPIVQRVCRNVLHDPHDIEDAFQATFFVLVRKAAHIAQPHLLGPWLHGVAHRIAVRARAKAAQRHFHERQAQVMSTRASSEDFDWRELGPIIEEEVHRLPEKYRLPFVLCYLEGKTNEEAAEYLGCPKGTILSRLARGRERLRARLTRRGVTLSAALFTAALSAATTCAAVPQTLVGATARAALLVAGGQTAVGVSQPALALADGMANAMLLRRLKVVAGLLLSLVFLGTGAVVLSQWVSAPQPAQVAQSHFADPARDKSVVPPPGQLDRPGDLPGPQALTGKDRYGDPLPPKALARLGSLRFRLDTQVSFLSFLPDGKRVIYGSAGGVDHHVRVADVETGRELLSFELQQAEVPLCMALSSDGKMLAAGLRKMETPVPNTHGIVVLWDVTTGAELRRLVVAAGEVNCLKFHPDGKIVAMIAGPQRGIQLWDLHTFRELPCPIQPNGKVGTLAFSDDGKLLAFSSVQGNRKSVFLCTTSPWRALHVVADALTHSSALTDVLAFSPDGDLLAGVDGANVRLWDTATALPSKPDLPRPGGTIAALSFSADGKTLAVGQNHLSKGLILWDVATRKEVHALPTGKVGLRALAFSPTRPGQPALVATGGADGSLRIWDAVGGIQQNTLPGHLNALDAVALLPGGKAVTVSREEKAYRLWDALTGQELSKGTTGVRDIASVLAAPAANILAVTEFETPKATVAKTVRLIDVVAGKELRRLEGEGEGEGETAMVPMAVTPDGKTLAAAVGSRRVVIWDAAAGTVLRRLELDKDLFGPATVPPAALSPDGKLLALRLAVPAEKPGVDKSVFLVVLDTTTGRQRWCLKTSLAETDSLVFSPDGKMLAEGSMRFIRVWESETGNKLRQFSCLVPGDTMYQAYPQRLAFSPDGKTLIAGNGGQWVFLWDLTTGKERRRFAAHRGRVVAVSVSPDGRMFATASDDATAMIWDLGER